MAIPLKLVLILTAIAAAYYDLRVRRIPNWLNLCGVVLGLGLNTYFESLHGTWTATSGLLLALCIYTPLYVLKGMGAGDVKLMAAIGAISGPANWLFIFIATALLGGVISLTLVVLKKRAGQTVSNISVIVTQLAQGQSPARRDGLSIYDERSLKMPHGAVIAAGVCLFLMLHRNV